MTGGELKRIPDAFSGPKHGLAWSPDGARSSAYLGNPDLTGTPGARNNPRLLVLPAEGQATTGGRPGRRSGPLCWLRLPLRLARGLGAGDPIQWNASSNTLFFPVSERGITRDSAYLIEQRRGDKPTWLSPAGGELGGFTHQPQRLAPLSRSATPVCPQELVVLLEPRNRQERECRRCSCAYSLPTSGFSTGDRGGRAGSRSQCTTGSGGCSRRLAAEAFRSGPRPKGYPCVVYVQMEARTPSTAHILMQPSFSFWRRNGYVVSSM